MNGILALWTLMALGSPDDPEVFRWPAIAESPIFERSTQDRELAEVERSRSQKGVLTVGAALDGRFSLPFGYADRDVFIYGNGIFVIDSHISWADLFEPGWGASLTIDVGQRMTRAGNMGPAGFEIGGYLSLQQMKYGGGSVDDEAGNSLHASDLNVSAWMVGVKVGQPMQGQQFFADGKFGLGAVHYSEVEGTFNGPLQSQFRDVLFKDTWTFAMELLGHAGIRFGPLGLSVGGGFNLWMPPNEGGAISMDSGPIYNFFLELGVELSF